MVRFERHQPNHCECGEVKKKLIYMKHMRKQRPIVVKRKSDCYRQRTEWMNKQRHKTAHVLPGAECAYEFIFQMKNVFRLNACRRMVAPDGDNAQ